MNKNNELNDIILNKGGSTNNNKKIILAVATLGVILIVVVMLMNSLTSNGTDNLPQTPIPPKAESRLIETTQNEPLFEEVEILEEEIGNNDNLDAIAARLKEESQEALKEEVIVEEEVIIVPVIQKPVAVKKVTKPAPVKQVRKAPSKASKVYYYIQIGSFSKYAPNKKFLKSVTDLGYQYKFHKIIRKGKTINKVLVGPFKSSLKAKNARRVLRAKVEPGAFLVKL